MYKSMFYTAAAALLFNAFSEEAEDKVLQNFPDGRVAPFEVALKEGSEPKEIPVQSSEVLEQKISNAARLEEGVYRVILDGEKHTIEALHYASEDSIYVLIRQRGAQKSIMEDGRELPLLSYHKRYGMPTVGLIEESREDGKPNYLIVLRTKAQKISKGDNFRAGKDADPRKPYTTLIRYEQNKKRFSLVNIALD